MSIRNSLALALVLASAGLFGCEEPRAAEPPSGAIEIVVRSPSDGRQLGTLTVRSARDSKTWRLPLRAEGYQQQRVLLEPGLYALDFEADIGAAVADPRLESRLHTASEELPRWVVVAPARVTTVNIAAHSDTSAPGVAVAPDPRLQVN
jgi:hypothetical protein